MSDKIALHGSLSTVSGLQELQAALHQNAVQKICMCRLAWLSGMDAANIWDSVDGMDTWPCDLSDSNQSVQHFEFVPVELREQVRHVHLSAHALAGIEPQTLTFPD